MFCSLAPRIAALLLLCVALSSPVEAGGVTVTWDANRETDIAGYVLFYGTQTGVYSHTVDVGSRTSFAIADLTEGQRYFFALRAYTRGGVQSPLSAEVSAVVGTCGASLSATRQFFGAGAATGEFVVAADEECVWSATTETSWISLTTVEGASGSDTVTYTLAPNTGGSARTGTLVVAGQRVFVTQAGTSCTYAVAGDPRAVAAEGGALRVGVTTDAGCAWSAASQSPWIAVSTGAVGQGGGGADLTVAANPDATPRTGVATVAGQLVTVTQAARTAGSVAVLIGTPTSLDTVVTSTPTTVVAGTATASAGVAVVSWSSDRGAAGTATGTSTWTTGDVALQPGDNVITVTATTAEGATATDRVTVTLVPPAAYFAEGATGEFFDFDLVLVNPNDRPAPVSLTFLKEDGATVTRSIAMGARSQTTVSVDRIPGLESAPVSVVVQSTPEAPVVAERTMMWGGGYGGHGATAAAAPSSRWLFAEGAQGFFDTYILLANPQSVAADVHVRFLLESGAPVVKRYSLLPMARMTVFAGAIAELAGRSFAVVVESSQPILAERSMYFGGTRFWEGGHASGGVTAPATRWFHAEGATGDFFDSYVLVANPNDQAATVTFTYLLDSGQTITDVRRIEANSRTTVEIARVDPRLANAAVSTTVTSDQPVVSERSMFWGGATPDTWVDAHNSFGIVETGTAWAVADGRSGEGDRRYETFILLANPGTQAADVRITFLREDGGSVVRTYHVPATSRYNVHVSTMVQELNDSRFGALIEVLNGVPVAVEKALYWNSGGRQWDAGTNVTATRLR